MKNFCFVLCVWIMHANQTLGSETGMPQLNTEYWTAQIFWLIVILSSLYIILWKIFLPKITVSIENRKLKVVNDLNEAQTLKENAEIKLKEYDRIIEETQIESKKLLENSKKKIEEDIKNKILIFNKEIEKEILSTENEIENLKKNSVQSINKIAIETSSEIVKQITGTEVNGSNVSAIVEDISRKSLEKYK